MAKGVANLSTTNKPLTLFDLGFSPSNEDEVMEDTMLEGINLNDIEVTPLGEK
jgi:hypothetical protein